MLEKVQSQSDHQQEFSRERYKEQKVKNSKIVRKYKKRGYKRQKSALKVKSSSEQQKQKQQLNKISFQERGFDRTKTQETLLKIKEIFLQIRKFAKTPNSFLGRYSWNQLYKRLVNNAQSGLFLIKKDNQYYLASMQSLQQISEQDAKVWETVSDILQKMKEGLSGPGLEGLINQWLGQAQQILAKCELQIQNSMQQQDLNKQMEDLYRQFYHILARKTFKQCFDDTQIDQLNYFQYKQVQQGHASSHNPINNIDSFWQFLGKRRKKNRKSPAHILHVSCHSCLSPYSQSSNMMVNCSECKDRYHKICLKEKVNRCGRCIYSRMSKELKELNPECHLCGVTHLGTSQIYGTRFAHNFCLLAHNVWTIKNNKIEELTQIVKERQLADPCQICNKQTQFISYCQICAKRMHPLCAYFNGYQIQYDISTMEISIDCCEKGQNHQQKIAKQRKFMLNYQKCVYDPDDENPKPKSTSKRKKKKSK